MEALQLSKGNQNNQFVFQLQNTLQLEYRTSHHRWYHVEKAALDLEVNSCVTLDELFNISEPYFFSVKWDQPPSCRIEESNEITYVKELWKLYSTKNFFFFWPPVTVLFQPETTWSIIALRILKMFCHVFWYVINVNTFSNSFLLNWKMWQSVTIWLQGACYWQCVEAKVHLQIHDHSFLSYPIKNCEYSIQISLLSLPSDMLPAVRSRLAESLKSEL